MLAVVGLIVCNVVNVKADSEGYTFENETQRDTSGSSTGELDETDMQVAGNKVYYLWHQYDGAFMQMWMAYADLDGSDFVAVQLTTGGMDSMYGQLEIVGEKIYYIYGRMIGRWEIHTATSNLDGSNFSPTQQTFNDGYRNYYGMQLDVYEDKIYYTFSCDYPNWPIYTATSNLDGSGWSATIRAVSQYWWTRPLLVVDDSKIYYVWPLSDGANYQIWTSESDLDGSNFSTVKRTTSLYNKTRINFILDGTKLYYAYIENDGTNDQIWTAEMNTNGTNWVATKQTNNSYDHGRPVLMLYDSKIYYNYTETDGTNYQIWMAHSELNGTNFTSEKISGSLFSKVNPLFWVDETMASYFWNELHGTEYHVFTANGNYQMIIDEGTTVTASVPSLLTFSIDGVTAGNACANSGGNASVTTTSSTIPFGTYTGAQTKIACQTLTVSTNATDGYVVTVQQDQDLTSAGNDVIAKFSGTYALPTTWSSPPGSGTNSYFGFTTDDTDYSAFQANKYSQITANNTSYNVTIETQPVADEANVISYQLEVNNLQAAGVYTNTVMYIATATF